MKADDVEESLRKRFKKELFSPFCKAINKYDLIQPNDKIAVCISGGKDSFLLAKLFQELKRRRNFMESKEENLNATANDGLDHNGKNKENRSFELVFLVMDPGYSKTHRKQIEDNAKLLNIPIKIFKSNIFGNVENIEKSPCYICARMRRGYLYSEAKKLGCNKIALGHHYDDVIETILMGIIFSGQFQTMMPKLKSTNFEGMELIRPMYLIREKNILAWKKYNNLNFLQCACKFTEKNKDVENNSMRLKIKNLIADLAKENPLIEGNIFKSVENVNLSTIISYKDKFGEHNFLDNY